MREVLKTTIRMRISYYVVYALHELAEGYYLISYILYHMIQFVQNGHTNHANIKAHGPTQSTFRVYGPWNGISRSLQFEIFGPLGTNISKLY